MPFYTGSTADGSDIRPIEGMYINPDNDNEWSSEPYIITSGKNARVSEKQLYYSKHYRKLVNHIDGKRTILDEYKLIKSKQSELSKDMRDFVIGLIEEEE